MHLSVHTPHTIQVWGLVSFIRFGFCQSLCIDKRKYTPHFLYILISLSILELMGSTHTPMRTIICLWGNAEIGKTSAILSLWGRLNIPNHPPLHSAGKDICAILPFCNSTVGFASQGDPNSMQSDWLQELIAAKCEVIVCASRSKGGTVATVEQLAEQYEYKTIWLSPLSSSNGINTNLLNDLTANMIVELIKKCLNH